MRPFLFVSAAVALCALHTPADPPRKAQPVHVRFQLEANLMWVDVMLDGKGPFRMAVDTGASTTVVLPGPAKEKGLIDREPRGDFFGAGTEFLNVGAAKVGELEVSKLKVAIMSVPQLSTPADLLELKADGVLGFNFLSRYVTTIDYKAQTISFVESDFVPPDPEQGVPGLHKGSRTWFGVQVEDADVRDVRGQGYDGGIVVNLVVELSPAERAGIKEGDIIVDIGGSPMVKAASLRDFLARSAPGQKVVVTLLRQGELWEKDLVVGKLPEKPSKK